MPEDEDRRRLCRERKTLTVERVQHHVNRIKGLLFSQGLRIWMRIPPDHWSPIVSFCRP
jgi:transposase